MKKFKAPNSEVSVQRCKSECKAKFLVWYRVFLVKERLSTYQDH